MYCKTGCFRSRAGIISCNGKYSLPGEHLYTVKSGTSMATPVVSGALACLLSKISRYDECRSKTEDPGILYQIPGDRIRMGLLNVERLLRV